jgi:hypothetical protein
MLRIARQFFAGLCYVDPGDAGTEPSNFNEELPATLRVQYIRAVHRLRISLAANFGPRFAFLPSREPRDCRPKGLEIGGDVRRLSVD